MPIPVVYKLEIRPFAEWARGRVEKHYRTVQAFASETGQDYVWFRAALKEEFKSVPLDTVDTILCKDGTAHIRELYPNIYEE